MPVIANYKTEVLDGGRFRLDGGAMFGIVPKVLWERRIPADARNRIPLAMRCLLLRGQGRTILIDTGIGDKLSPKMRDIYAVEFPEGTLLEQLARRGIAPEEVTDVILTHLHFDHCGGSTRYVDDRLVPTFPEARYYVQREHWDWATHPNLREQASFIKENFLPLEAAGRLVLLEGPGELFPGISLHVVHGHTHGQQLVRIHDDRCTLLYAADLVPTHAHIPLPWIMAYDVEPLRTLDEKTRLLEQAYLEGWVLFFEHDPEVEIMELEKGAKGWEGVRPRSLEAL